MTSHIVSSIDTTKTAGSLFDRVEWSVTGERRVEAWSKRTIRKPSGLHVPVHLFRKRVLIRILQQIYPLNVMGPHVVDVFIVLVSCDQVANVNALSGDTAARLVKHRTGSICIHHYFKQG